MNEYCLLSSAPEKEKVKFWARAKGFVKRNV
jgi:hypothetical protein